MSSSFSARWVWSITPLSRASAAASRIRPVETENGEHGARPTRTIASGRGSWKASTTRIMSSRIARSSSTRLSGGRPPALSPTLIAPARRVEADADGPGRLDRVLEPHAVRVEVEVVRAHRAARERELGEADLGRDDHVLGLHPRPDRVERLQPAEEQRVLPGRHRLRQRLVEVMVGVDEPRRHHAAAGVEHLGALRRRRSRRARRRRRWRRPRRARRRRARGGRRPW